MFIGLDVITPFSKKIGVSSSVLAGVGSLDALFSTYTASIRVQNQEEPGGLSQDIAAVFRELFFEYFKANGTKPENIILFRAGVSVDCFEDVRLKEIAAIQKVIKKYYTKTKVNLTVIAVQKSSDTKFKLPSDQTQKPKYIAFSLNTSFSLNVSVKVTLFTNKFINHFLFTLEHLQDKQVHHSP